MPRPDAFGPDFGLLARMAMALLLNAVLLAGLIAGAVWLTVSLEDGWAFVAVFAALALAGAAAPARRRRSRRSRHRRAGDARRVEEAVSRLAVLADVRAPAVRVEVEAAPLSWTTAAPGRPARLHVTTGLLDRLPDAELEAVIAHELSHVAQRDAMLMTVLAAPGIFVLRGLRRAWHDFDVGLRGRVGLILFATLFVPPAIVSGALARIVSRHRELAADRGAALLTGSPAALASALARLSEGLAGIPAVDLRQAAPRDPLHVMPARRVEARGLARAWATHPPLRQRVSQLERLEAALQA